MKKNLFLTLAIAVFTTNVAMSQTVSTTELKQHSVTRWKENLKIGYFGEAVGPNLHRWDDNQYDQNGEKTSTPANLYNQINVSYKFLSGTSLLLSPRFYAQIGDRNELRDNEDQHTVVADDWLVGVVQDYYRSKTLNYRGRLSHRHPVSTYSKNAQIDSQIEYQNDLTLFPTTGLTVLHWNTLRYYAYEAGKNEDRYRINFTTIFNYDLNDKWKTQLFHEWDMQHRAPKYGNRDVNKQDWNYFEKYKNQVAVAIGYSPTPRFTIMPFVKALNDENWSAETTQLGMWLFGKIY